MNAMQTEADFINFANDNHIPLLFVYDDLRLPGPGNYPTFVCFERDYDQIRRVLPIVYFLESIPNQIEHTSKRLELEYRRNKNE